MTHASPNATATEAIGRRPWRFLGRALIILLLIPLLAATWALRVTMPPVDLRAEFDGRRPFVYWKDNLNVQLTYTGDPHKADDELISLMNVETGKITHSTRADLAWHYGVNSRGERLRVGGPLSFADAMLNGIKGIPNPPPERLCAYFKNMETGETRRVEFDWPPAKNGFLSNETINSRFVVSRDFGNIYAIDLEDAQPQIFSVVSPNSGTDLHVKHIYGTDLLYEIYPPTQANSNLHKLELFKLADHQIQLVKSLEIGCSGITRFNGQMLTLSPDGTQVEIHSLEDLTLVKTIDISEQFLATHTVIDLQGNLLIGTNTQDFNHDYYDIFSGEQLKLPFSGMHIRWWSGELTGVRYWCFSGGKGWMEKYAYVYDLKEQRVRLEIPYDCKVSFLEDGRFAVSYPAYGVCTEVYDLETGISIRNAPYQWYAVAQAALLLAWFGWWIAWLVVSAREGSWLCFDLAMIFGIVPGILVCLGVVEIIPNIGFWKYSANFATLSGLFIGLLYASALLFTLSRSRLALALLPLTLAFAVLCVWLSSIATQMQTDGQSRSLTIGLTTTTCTVLLAAVGVIIRVAGIRLSKGTTTNAETHDQPSQLALHDMFVLIFYAAVVMFVLKPLVIPLPQNALQQVFHSYWLPTAFTAATASGILMLAILSPRIWMARIGCVVAVVVWLTLVVQQLLIQSGLFYRLVTIQSTAVQTIVIASTTAFVCALAFRLRNYRLRHLQTSKRLHQVACEPIRLEGARASSPNVTDFQSKCCPGSASRCSSPLVHFSERGRPRPLNLRLMQTQLVLAWLERRARFTRCLGLMVPQADGDVRAPVNPTTFTCRDPRSLHATAPPIG